MRNAPMVFAAAAFPLMFLAGCSGNDTEDYPTAHQPGHTQGLYGTAPKPIESNHVDSDYVCFTYVEDDNSRRAACYPEDSEIISKLGATVVANKHVDFNVCHKAGDRTVQNITNWQVDLGPDQDEIVTNDFTDYPAKRHSRTTAGDKACSFVVAATQAFLDFDSDKAEVYMIQELPDTPWSLSTDRSLQTSKVSLYYSG